MLSSSKTFRMIQQGRWVALDTETTGLGRRAEILEIAVLAADGRVLVDSLVKPRGRLGAQHIHGLTEQHLAAAPSWPSIWSKVQPHLRGVAVVAFHAAFDLRLLRQTCALHALPCLLRSPVLCVRRFLDCPSSISLQALCHRKGLDLEVKHRAAPDAELVRRLVVEALVDMKASGGDP